MSEFENILMPGKQMAGISSSAKIEAIKGPYDGKINSIYQIVYDSGISLVNLVFRARISRAFRYEDVVKEKILFPIMDGSLKLDHPHAKERVEALIKQETGSHIFSPQEPAIIPTQDLYHYDESRKLIPYIYTVMEFVKGVSVFDYLEKVNVKNKRIQDIPGEIISTIEGIFTCAGDALGRMHHIRFPGFYTSILDIGDHEKEQDWKTIFLSRADALIAEAARHDIIKPLLPSVRAYIKKHANLIRNEEIPVLFHNDFQPQNFIMNPDDGKITGYIDFDNWQVGPKEQDFIKIQHWCLDDLDPHFGDAFLKGYTRQQAIDPTIFQEKVNLYKMAWFLLVFNFEMDKILKNEMNLHVDQRFPMAERYLGDIKRLLDHAPS